VNPGETIGALFVRIGSDLTDLHMGLGPGGKADKELESFTARVNSGLGNMLKFAAGLAAVGLVAVAVGLGAATDKAVAFQQSMRLLQTQAGASAAEVDQMSAAVLGLAGKVGTSPEELAAGLYHLESAGFRGQKALEALTIAAEGAKVGNANLEDVTNALDAVLVAGVPEAKNMAGAMGELNAIVGAGDMRMQDLADAMGTGILASAKTFGLGLKDVGAALAVMGDNNIRGSDAATKLRMSISLMGATTDKAAKALKSVGISSTELAQKMRSGGLVAALQDLHDKLQKSGKTAVEQARILSQAFGGGKSAGTILLLLQQLDRLKSKEEEIGKGATGFQAAWQNTTKNFSFQWDAAKAALDAAAIKVGTKLLPVLTDLFKNVIVPLIPKLSDLASTWMDKAVPAVEQFAGWLASLKPDFVTAFNIISTLKPYLIDIGVAWIAWNVALKVTAALNMIQFLAQLVTQSYIAASATKGMTLAQWALNVALDANPIGLVIVAVAALAAAGIYLYTHWKPFRDFVNGLWDDLKKFGSWLQTNLGPILKDIGDALGAVGNFFGGSHATKSYSPSDRVPHFATGGMVPGPIGSPTLAVLHGGERVMTPAQLPTIRLLTPGTIKLLTPPWARPSYPRRAALDRL
jgi:TP901 family phage tail tape measure protein